MKGNITEQLEREELIQKLRNAGYSKFVDAFLLHDNKTFTKRFRLNKSGACRVLNCKPKELEDALAACREILREDLSVD